MGKRDWRTYIQAINDQKGGMGAGETFFIGAMKHEKREWSFRKVLHRGDEGRKEGMEL
ncbi:hypothetical protein [Peribacillus deserti]|uniref:hypothetical protein n=1 Tax=Peribacillus deserti TaxID=673318 RepID=UPI0015E14A91|nr:hypothetical protein [Peribacillus deserti]